MGAASGGVKRGKRGRLRSTPPARSFEGAEEGLELAEFVVGEGGEVEASVRRGRFLERRECFLEEGEGGGAWFFGEEDDGAFAGAMRTVCVGRVAGPGDLRRVGAGAGERGDRLFEPVEAMLEAAAGF